MEESVSAAEVKRTSSSETYLHALLKYTNYSIQVLAYTGAGDGILSPAVFCTTEEDSKTFDFFLNTTDLDRPTKNIFCLMFYQKWTNLLLRFSQIDGDLFHFPRFKELV